MNLLIIPAIILSSPSINATHMFILPPIIYVTPFVFLFIHFLIYMRAFKFPPSRRPPHAAGDAAAFGFPLLLWSRPILVIIVELTVLGYWILMNRVHVIQRHRNLSLALLLAAGLAVSPMLAETFIIRPAYDADIVHEIPDNVSTDIIPAIENVNLTALFNRSFYFGRDSLGAVKAYFQSEINADSSIFLFSFPLLHSAWYEFIAMSFASSVNFTYWIDVYSSPHARADVLNGSTIFNFEMEFLTLYVNQSLIPLPSTTPQTRILGGTVLLARVQFYYACGCTCGIFTVWFLMNPQLTIISVIFCGS